MKRLVIALSLALSSCYLEHGVEDDGGLRRDGSARPDVASSCAPAGTYDTAVRVVSSSPEGCAAAPSSVPIRIPPRVEDFASMCGTGSGTVTETSPCEWRIDTECLIPDASTTVTGTIDAHDGAVHGRLDVVQGGFAGECRFSFVLGE